MVDKVSDVAYTIKMNDIYNLSLLYDFYGELLTENQKSILDEYINADLTISEIATNRNVSRQSIHETIKRAEKIFLEYESKLKLVNRFKQAKEDVLYAISLLEREDISLCRDELKAIINKVFQAF